MPRQSVLKAESQLMLFFFQCKSLLNHSSLFVLLGYLREVKTEIGQVKLDLCREGEAVECKEKNNTHTHTTQDPGQLLSKAVFGNLERPHAKMAGTIGCSAVSFLGEFRSFFLNPIVAA